MKKQAYYNPKSLKWLISLAVMIILSAGVIVATVAIDKSSVEKSGQKINVGFTVSSTSPIDITENEYNVTSVQEAFDEKGDMVGYVIGLTTIGYNQEVPIEMDVTVTKDASVVCGIDIIKQEETEYLGVRIQQDDFKNQFVGRKLPVKNKNSIEKGSDIDIIARSTISSQAVIDGVNNAQSYVQDFLKD